MQIKIISILYLLLSVFFLHNAVAVASSPVWQVSKGDKHFYIGGTIHLLSKQDFPLPKSFEFAYQNSQALVLEIDLAKTTTPSFQQQLMMQMSYPYGESLQDHLSAKTFARLAQHFKNNNKNIDEFKNFRVGYISMLITVFELQNLNMAGIGVDKYFFNRAEQDNKMIVGLETLTQHFNALALMGEKYGDKLITHSLDELAILTQQLESMKQAWRSGDLVEFDKTSVEPIRSNFPTKYQTIIVDRNQAWLPKIASLINASKTTFVLVGHAHLSGEEGLINQLELKGFTLKQLP